MSMTLSGNGTITGLVSGGLPDATITSAELASNAVDSQTLTLLNASGSAPVYACRAWVNFNGTGTVAIRGSGNVSSITDNGTGDYTVNFTTAMVDANYTAVANCDTNPSYSVQFVSMFVSAVSNSTVSPTTSGFRLSTRESGGPGRDETYITASIFR